MSKKSCRSSICVYCKCFGSLSHWETEHCIITVTQKLCPRSVSVVHEAQLSHRTDLVLLRLCVPNDVIPFLTSRSGAKPKTFQGGAKSHESHRVKHFLLCSLAATKKAHCHSICFIFILSPSHKSISC